MAVPQDEIDLIVREKFVLRIELYGTASLTRQKCVLKEICGDLVDMICGKKQRNS